MDLTLDWEFVADTVMGGVSRGRIAPVTLDGRRAMQLTGDVSLENDGGFVQMAADLAPGGGGYDAGGFAGIEIDVLGNGERYDLRLRTVDLTRPWQSYRVDFRAPEDWVTRRFAFADFEPHRTDVPFDPAGLRRIGIVAIGHEFAAEVAVAGVRLYR
ncbi:Complex I intermediate-associated protein 30 (CIA30) [Loktanella atrilutea]|uniref:Complex I intermediate-associated protein 30 (CIA30) n=1 Tax=Loktanella atrilutea TaxID=366533 RepID=A0A1M5DUB3_LOKAT|nr:CIA30 family protein [Loktanella atrilutea]SHF70628.1 Complex I intermediate-associated protein 30 (CIA30) [Loktanella atrilutea]